jgi:hypothetical protein
VPRRIDPEAMDRQNPGWHSASASSAVWDYVFDPRDPKHFYVSPPQPASAQGHVALVYFGVPPDLATETDAIALDDTYVTALTHYVIYRAYLKEGEFSNPAGAMAHRSEFLGLLGAKDRAELASGAA